MDAVPAISARGLIKTYTSGFFRKKKKEVLHGIDLEVRTGVIYGVLGPNGAGKTTLISILSALNLPDGGELSVMGLDARRHADRVRARVNISSGNPNFIWNMSVMEILSFYQMLYGRRDARRIGELIALFDLEPYRRTRFEELSTGTKHKLALAKSLVNDPEVLFLDEPTVGLDPDASLRVRELIRQIHSDKRTTIVLTTHYMREAEELCEHISFLKQGRVLAAGTPEELKAMIRTIRTIEIHFSGTVVASDLQAIPGVTGVEIRDDLLKIAVENPEERLDQVVEVVRRSARVTQIKMSEVDLEDVFIEFAKA
jgi:ABC-2 type transport system ATP-binding protein